LTKASSQYKQFAMNKALELARVLPERQPLVNVQQNTQVNSFQQAEGLLEKMSKTADKILYDRATVIDAEVIKDV